MTKVTTTPTPVVDKKPNGKSQLKAMKDVGISV